MAKAARKPEPLNLEDQVQAQRAEVAEARSALTRLQASRPNVVTADDAELDEHHRALSLADRRIQRAIARQQQLGADLLHAQGVAEQDRRLQLYEQGADAAAKYRARCERYEVLAREIASIFEELPGLASQINAANAALPEGVARLTEGWRDNRPPPQWTTKAQETYFVAIEDSIEVELRPKPFIVNDSRAADAGDRCAAVECKLEPAAFIADQRGDPAGAARNRTADLAETLRR